MKKRIEEMVSRRGDGRKYREGREEARKGSK